MQKEVVMFQLTDYGSGGLVAGKTPWQRAVQQLSPYDYTQYCMKWSKANLTCTARDREPGRDVKTLSDYIPGGLAWKTDQLPPGYSCDMPYYFSDLQGASSAATADLSDVADAAGRVMKNRRGLRK